MWTARRAPTTRKSPNSAMFSAFKARRVGAAAFSVGLQGLGVVGSQMTNGDFAEKSALIGSIYDCALEPDLWPATLQRVCKAFGGHSAGIVLLDFVGAGDRLVRDWGPTTDWAERMGGVLDSVKRIHRQFLGMRGARLDEPIVLPRDLAPQVNVFSTPFYQEWAQPQRIHQVMEAVALSETTRLGLFCITRQDHMGVFSGDLISSMRDLAPHIRRAITISDLLDLRTVERQAFSAVIDSITTGICIVGAGGEILHANTAAKAMFENKMPIRSENGRLRAPDKTATAELLGAIAAAQEEEAHIGSNGIGVALGGTDGRHSVAHVLPLARGDVRTRLVPQALAAVFVNEDGPASFVNLDAIASSFEFTASETRLTHELVTGRTLAEAATALGVAESTVKTHLQNVFFKTGTSRQVDLNTLLHRLLPVARRPGEQTVAKVQS
jgi:DNA-binding CsgD family transcriptional regulator/PAS domain-containing protein